MGSRKCIYLNALFFPLYLSLRAPQRGNFTRQPVYDSLAKPRVPDDCFPIQMLKDARSRARNRAVAVRTRASFRSCEAS